MAAEGRMCSQVTEGGLWRYIEISMIAQISRWTFRFINFIVNYFTGDNMGLTHIVEDIVLTQILNNKVFSKTKEGVTIRYRIREGVKLVIEVQKGFETLFSKSYTLPDLSIKTLRELFDRADTFIDKVVEAHEFLNELKNKGWIIIEEGEEHGL